MGGACPERARSVPDRPVTRGQHRHLCFPRLQFWCVPCLVHGEDRHVCKQGSSVRVQFAPHDEIPGWGGSVPSPLNESRAVVSRPCTPAPG